MPNRPLLPPEQVGAPRTIRGGAHQKYFLDDRGRKLIMDLYDGSKERTDLLQRHLPGIPRRVIQKWAGELGKAHSRNYWSPEQDQYLRKNYNKLSLRKLEKNLKKYRTSIIRRINELGLVREDPSDGYTMTDVASGLGVGPNTMREWARKGLIKGTKETTAFNHDVWYFSDNAIRDFIRDHPNLLNPHKFDWPWVHSMCFLGIGRLDGSKHADGTR